MKALAITSGGMDSTTMGLSAKELGYDLTFIHFNYRQKCEKKEEEAIKKIGEILNIPVIIIDLPFFKDFGKGTSLVDEKVKVTTAIDNMNAGGSLYSGVWVPSRNVVFLAVASMVAEANGMDLITWGANQSEIAYPDNTLEFGKRFEHMLELGSMKKIKVDAPLYHLDKPHLLKWGFDHGYGEIYRFTWSCDDGQEKPCGRCGCCMNRRFSFKVLEKLYPGKYRDEQSYMDEDYFEKEYLPHLLKNCRKESWKYKYLELIK